MFTGATRGISLEGDILHLGVEHGVVRKTGAFFTHGETRLGQGRENAKRFLTEHKELARKIESQIREAAGLAPAASPESSDEAATEGSADVPTQAQPSAVKAGGKVSSVHETANGRA